MGAFKCESTHCHINKRLGPNSRCRDDVNETTKGAALRQVTRRASAAWSDRDGAGRCKGLAYNAVVVILRPGRE
jgi:hypothetical protein